MSRLLSAVAGATVAYDKVKEAKNETKEWMGRWWAAPLTAAYLGMQQLAFELFGDNEKLHTHIAVAPTISFLGGVAAGAIIDKLFHKHELAEKAAMLVVGGAVALGGAAVSLYANGELGLDGIQSGVGAVPVAEATFLAASSGGSVVLGLGVGEALHQEKPKS